MSRQTGSQASDGWGVPLRPPRGKNLNAAPSKGENQGGAGSGRGGGGGGAGGAGGGGGGGGGHNKCYKVAQLTIHLNPALTHSYSVKKLATKREIVPRTTITDKETSEHLTLEAPRGQAVDFLLVRISEDQEE